jgi:uncharacterized delta-60 repeat protein
VIYIPRFARTILLFFALACSGMLAQADFIIGTLDPTFDPAPDGAVTSIAPQIDGRIVVGGRFLAIGGVPRDYIGRLNADGSVDAAFKPGANGEILAIAIQTNGGILVGGKFTMLEGSHRYHLARIKPDGHIDSHFDPGNVVDYQFSSPGADGPVRCLALQADGRILVGGEFTRMGTSMRNHIARLNTDGSVDPTFNPGANSTVLGLAVQPDGKIIACGWFEELGGQARPGIGRINADGSLDTTFVPIGVESAVGCSLQADGRILVYGHWPDYPNKMIGRLNADGSMDQTFNVEANDDVASLEMQADGKILVSGWFTQIAGQSRNGIARLNPDGTIDNTFSPTANHEVVSLALQPNGDLLVGGTFTELAGQPCTNIGLITNIGPVAQTLTFNASKITWLRGGNSPEVYRTTFEFSTNRGISWTQLSEGTRINGGWELSSPNLPVTSTIRARGYVGGAHATWFFDSFAGHPAIWRQPVSRDELVGAATVFEVGVWTGSVEGTTHQWRKDGTNLIDGWPVYGAQTTTLQLTNLTMADQGSYTFVLSNALGCVTSIVAQLNVSVPARFDASLHLETDPDGDIRCLVPQADGKLLVGGWFSALSGQPRSCMGRLNADGSLDGSFDPNIDDRVYSIAVQVDGRILVGGSFLKVNGEDHKYMVRLNPDGTVDDTFSAKPDYDVRGIVVQADGKIIVTGDFNQLDGQPRNGIGRLNADGRIDSTFKSGVDNEVYCVALQADGKILVGGDFEELSGQPCESFGRLNINGSLDPTFDATVDGRVWTIAVQPDQKILLAGEFAELNGTLRFNTGRLNANGTLDDTFDAKAFDNVLSMAVQADGRILFGGAFDTLNYQPRQSLGRLYADGTLDATFNLEADDQVNSIVIQPDGKILLTGEFNELGGASCNGAGRLNNTAPATEQLTFDGSKITWVRGGTSPDVYRTTFDVSTDGGAQWTVLGNGTWNGGVWEISGLSLPANSTIRARGHAIMGSSSFVCESYCGKLAISVQPLNRTNSASTTTSFFAQAGGGGEACHYQWRRDGTNLVDGGNISGAQTSTLLLNSVLKPDEGNYTVVISNSSGSLTSMVSRLTVADPAILSQPTGLVRELGNSATLSIAAGGTLPLSYQWWKDGVALAGQTSSVLVLNGLSGANAGYYSAVISNIWGHLNSVAVPLTVNTATVDPSFIAGTDGYVTCIALQSDGKALIGGHFSMLGGQPRNNIGRLNADGTVDTAFNPGANDTVDCFAVQTDGKIVMGGLFTTLGGEAHKHIARLNPDGSVDHNFVQALDLYVSCVALQRDGRIVVGGRDGIQGDIPLSRIIRLNTDGTVDNTFNSYANLIVRTLAIQSDEKILVGGSFGSLGGESRNNIGRLNTDGSVDTSFNPGIRGDGVSSLVIQEDGKILVGGLFNMAAGHNCDDLARLNADGTLDNSFNPGTDGDVYTLMLQEDGRVLVGGRFGTVAGQTRNNIARLNRDGTLDTSFNPGIGGVYPSVDCLAISSDRGILVGGSFSTLGGQPRNSLGLLNGNAPAGPRIIADSSTQISTDGFKFNFSGMAGSSIVIESSTDLVQWTSIQTNVITGGVGSFTDPAAANSPGRYYRLRVK